MRHQDLHYELEYQVGEKNIADYLSRHARKWHSLSSSEKRESNNLVKLLYTLHMSPALDAIGIKEIAVETDKDPILIKFKKTS